MNKEYVYLSDGKLLVIDEKGHATMRIVDSDNMHDVLLLENDLEEINNKIDKLESELKNEIKFTKKEKLMLMLTPSILTMTACGIATLIEPRVGAHIIEAMVAAVLVTGVLYIESLLMNKKEYKYKNGMRNELSKAYEIREEAVERLSKAKIIHKDSIKIDLIETKKGDIKINDIVVLEPQFTPNYDEAITQLDNAYELGYNQKVKKLTMRKN